MGTVLTLLAIVGGSVGIVRLVRRSADRWFHDISSMDEDYPSEDHETTWPAGGTGSATF